MNHIRVPVVRPVRRSVSIPSPASVAWIVFACLLAAVLFLARLFLSGYLNIK